MATLEAQQLSRDLLEHVYALPDGQKIKECLQCGTCSASCPSAASMEYSPREIIAALRAGMLDRVLNSNTVWMCVSCYACTVRCPAGIPFADVMYELKRLEVERGLSRDVPSAVLSQAFVEVVDAHGRSAESKLLRKFYLRTNPFKALGLLPLAWKLFRRGRLELLPHTIRGISGLRKMMNAIAED